eukprot:2591338-Ditylum_brightwellii.AAC.1
MKHHMSTAKGISELCNSNTEDSPIYGSSQRATDSPTKWNLTDNIIAKAYSKKSKGRILKDPTKTMVKKQFSARYVDDITKLHNNSKVDIAAVDLMHQIQHDVNLQGRYFDLSTNENKKDVSAK